MLKAFNSFQLTGLFAAWPFLIEWLSSSATFTGHAAAFWVAIIMYVIGFFCMCGAVFTTAEKW